MKDPRWKALSEKRFYAEHFGNTFWQFKAIDSYCSLENYSHHVEELRDPVHIVCLCTIFVLHGGAFSLSTEAMQGHPALGQINPGCMCSMSHTAGVWAEVISFGHFGKLGSKSYPAK